MVGREIRPGRDPVDAWHTSDESFAQAKIGPTFLAEGGLLGEVQGSGLGIFLISLGVAMSALP